MSKSDLAMEFKNKFNIGNIVQSTGLTGNEYAYGVVATISNPMAYKMSILKAYGDDPTLFKSWDNYFPHWIKAPVYTIKLVVPTRGVSFLEYCSHLGLSSATENKEEYFEKIELQQMLNYVEEDLILYADCVNDVSDEELSEMFEKMTEAA
jgi:hypothetical protein